MLKCLEENFMCVMEVVVEGRRIMPIGVINIESTSTILFVSQDLKLVMYDCS
jgi:hypothetical protein